MGPYGPKYIINQNKYNRGFHICSTKPNKRGFFSDTNLQFIFHIASQRLSWFMFIKLCYCSCTSTFTFRYVALVHVVKIGLNNITCIICEMCVMCETYVSILFIYQGLL